MITATLLTLLVVPVLYSFVESTSDNKGDGGSGKTVMASIVMALCLIGFSVNTIQAQEKTLTMEEAVNIALQNNAEAFIPGLF